MLAPEVTVAAIAEDAGRFLLVEERIKQRRVFNQPAGHVERGETLLAAVVREAREESAWRFVPRALVGIYLWRNPATRRPVLRFAFAGRVCEHDPAQPLDRGILTTHWLTPAQLRRRRASLRSPLVLRCIEDYLGGAQSSLDGVAALERGAATAQLDVAAARCAGVPLITVGF
jgi:8-oxo-dGTP pyrophosphatase MutT (NUDIX family)